MKLKNIGMYLKDPRIIVLGLGKWGYLRWLSDKAYIKLIYRITTKKKLNLKEPQTFNEKLQWLKLYDRKPEYTTMVDKYAVKQLVAEQIGEEYIIPTLGVWNTFEEIDFDSLPTQFVLKCTHDSGGLVICRDKAKLEMKRARNKIRESLRNNYFWMSREWPYKNVRARILAEMYMQDGDTEHLPVYKILNFNGEPRIIQAIQNDKTENETIDYFDPDWNLLELRQNFPNSAIPTARPPHLAQMLELSRKLSKGFPFLRTDWYIINGKIYFSEYTFYSDSGLAHFTPEKWDEVLGGWIDLQQPIKQLTK